MGTVVPAFDVFLGIAPDRAVFGWEVFAVAGEDAVTAPDTVVADGVKLAEPEAGSILVGLAAILGNELILSNVC